MAISKSTQDKQTKIKLETAYLNTKSIVGKLTKTDFSSILKRQKQNISRRIGYNGFLLIDEAVLLLQYLAKNNLNNNDFYFELSQIVNPTRPNKRINEIKNCNEQDEDYLELNVRGSVSLSCGYGSFVDNDSITGTCKVPRTTLRQYGASTTRTEIVYAQGDSMSPEIKSGDALLVDTSQTDIIDGVVYAFNYDGQPMCKRLQKIGKEITAISSNPLFKTFTIDFSCQFNIIGRVVGFMRPVL